MGCTYSGQNRGNEDGIRSFRVHNVDDQGMELNRGVIEIRENDLVLYQKGKEPIRWPLRCLRRYGFDAELFSFESGRRCVMGPGIYAFKCAHAEELFNLVQESIQRAGVEDQRGQQFSHNHAVNVSHSNRQTAQQAASENLTQEHSNSTYGPGTEQPHNGQVGSQTYVNGILVGEAGHEYVNSSITRPISGAFQIDETAALIDFLHNPPGVGDTGNSQVNYAELCMPDPHLSQSSMENLLDETGQDTGPHVSRTAATHRLSQHSLLSGVRITEYNRISMPNDILAGASQDSDSVLQSADSDVFLTDVPPEEGQACLNYVNLALEEGGGAASASAPAPQEILLPPSHEIVSNYANLTLHGHRVHRPFKQVNYIVIDHKSQSCEAGSSGTGNPGNNSPTSPVSCMSIPESPCRKTESYAMIDFDRTVALSSVTRATEDAGSRKTRHNSTISEMP